MIEVKNLSYEIDRRPILHHIDLTIHDGSTYVLLGPSGCGKSTILRNIIGLATPTQGEILFDGVDITRCDRKGKNIIRTQCGFLFQQSALFDSLTIEENLKFPILQQRHKYSEKEMKRMVDEKLEMVEMPGVNRMYPSELSGGMRKRAALARSIILEPRYIFYDEPTTGLDPIMSQVIGDLILSLSERLKITSIVVTHDMKLAFFVGDKIGLMHEGVLKVEGDQTLFRTSNDPLIRQFVEGNSSGPIKLKSVGV